MSIILVSCAFFFFSLAAIWSGLIPSYTEDTARAVNVSHCLYMFLSRTSVLSLTFLYYSDGFSSCYFNVL